LWGEHRPAPFGNGSWNGFSCPCHFSIYTKAGICIAGLGTRNMDSLQLKQQPDGSLWVFKSPIRRGASRLPDAHEPG
jgi:Rieske Fe-S protein